MPSYTLNQPDDTHASMKAQAWKWKLLIILSAISLVVMVAVLFVLYIGLHISYREQQFGGEEVVLAISAAVWSFCMVAGCVMAVRGSSRLLAGQVPDQSFTRYWLAALWAMAPVVLGIGLLVVLMLRELLNEASRRTTPQTVMLIMCLLLVGSFCVVAQVLLAINAWFEAKYRQAQQQKQWLGQLGQISPDHPPVP